MNYWLFKTEPDDISLQDIAAAGKKGMRWDGIRNYQARNFIRDQLRRGDGVFIYHSQCKAVGIVGSAEISSDPYPDPAQFDDASPYFDAKASPDKPRWFCIDIVFRQESQQPLLLSTIKTDPTLADMVLVKQGRLSVQPVSVQQWRHICKLTELAR